MIFPSEKIHEVISCVDRDGGPIPGGEEDHGKIVPMDRGEVKFRRFRLFPLPFVSLRTIVKCVTPILKDRENYLGWFAVRCFGKKGKIGEKGSWTLFVR